jgi:hypothetical protein
MLTETTFLTYWRALDRMLSERGGIRTSFAEAHTYFSCRYSEAEACRLILMGRE